MLVRVKWRKLIPKALLYLLMIALTAFFLGPFLWLVSTSLKPRGANIFVYPPQLIPKPATLKNYLFALSPRQFPFLRYTANTFLITGVTVVCNLFLSSLAGYPMARMHFFGKNAIFYAILSTMIIPFHTIMISLFIVCLKLGINDSYAGAILPFTVSAFGIFLMRQAFRGVPEELADAARMDGCSHWGIFIHIMLPLAKPALGALALFTFVARWNSFLWPLIILTNEARWTLQQGIATLSGFFGTDWATMTSAMVLSMIPVLVLFLSLQRFFLEQYAGALKG